MPDRPKPTLMSVITWRTPESERRGFIPGVVPPPPPFVIIRIYRRLTPYLAEIDSSLFNEEPPFFVIAAAAGVYLSRVVFIQRKLYAFDWLWQGPTKRLEIGDDGSRVIEFMFGNASLVTFSNKSFTYQQVCCGQILDWTEKASSSWNYDIIKLKV